MVRTQALIGTRGMKIMGDRFDGILLQESPRIYFARVPGHWLLKRTTPSWRIKDPEKGFQRVVNEKRARQIAATVLDEHRTFPNAIVLATDFKELEFKDCSILIPPKARFLIVDGQHRTWAQKFSKYEAYYACVIHIGLSESEMASLFLEINDNQKRVPASLRWDLVRLVRPEEDPSAVRAAELIYQLATEPESPLYQRVDLTGEQPQITLKQASLAPEIKVLISKRASPLYQEGYEIQLETLIAFFAAVRERDPDGWRNATSPLYKARVARALLRLLPEICEAIRKPVKHITSSDFYKLLKRIDLSELSDDRIRAIQGSAGIREITSTIRNQIFG